MKSYMVIGLGRFGGEAARQLSRLGNEVLAMDTEAELVQQISEEVTHAVVGDGGDKGVLKALGTRNMDCAIVAIGDDLAQSVLVTMNLKELGVPYIVCKAYDETHRKVLEKLGADLVIIPEKENATRLARKLSANNMLDYFELDDECSIVEMRAPKPWIGKSLIELNVRAKMGINIIGIRQSGKINTVPSPSHRFTEEDVVVLMGDNKAMSVVQKL